jgi:Protein phosphatase 2C
MTSLSPHWRVVAASCTGASHVAAGTANQDAYATATRGSLSAVAVADGHGHPMHFRSGRGARLAVELALRLVATVAEENDPAVTLQHRLRHEFTPLLVTEWRRSVMRHVALVPFSAIEQPHLVGDDEEAMVRPYGTTLLVLVGSPVAVGFAQLGDGDIVAVVADGEVIRPLPEDPQLDGIHTTSLSSVTAARSMRVQALDLASSELAVAFAATDGFGAPQLDGAGWWRQVGQELAGHLRMQGVDWISEKLPVWLAEPANTGGDDTTMGLLLNTETTH